MIDELNEACNHLGVLAGQPLVSDGPGAAAPGPVGQQLHHWFTGLLVQSGSHVDFR